MSIITYNHKSLFYDVEVVRLLHRGKSCGDTFWVQFLCTLAICWCGLGQGA